MKKACYIIYKLFYKLKLRIPLFVSKMITYFVFKIKINDEVEVNTSDLSKQAVHPDFIYYKGEKCLTLTPYPFGIDAYENPEFHLYNNGKFKRSNHFAEFYPEKITYDHYSDPVMFVYDNMLHVCLRWTNKLDNHNKLYIVSSDNLIEWTEPSLFIESDSDKLISPAVYVQDGRYAMYTVDEKKSGNVLYYRSKGLSSDSNWVQAEEVTLLNLPKGYKIWHIAIDHENIDRGLFLVVNKGTYKLFLSKRISVLEWALTKEIILPTTIGKNVNIIYKSCFYIENKLLVSVMLKDLSWRIIELKVRGDELYG